MYRHRYVRHISSALFRDVQIFSQLISAALDRVGNDLSMGFSTGEKEIVTISSSVIHTCDLHHLPAWFFSRQGECLENRLDVCS